MDLTTCIASKARGLIDAFNLHGAELDELFDFVFILPGLAWSYVNLNMPDDDFLPVLSAKFLTVGREVDRRVARKDTCSRFLPRSGVGTSKLPAAAFLRASSNNDVSLMASARWKAQSQISKPEILADLRGMAVVLKPCGWEVDGSGSVANDCELLSKFVQAAFGESDYPLLYSPAFDHGFIHRLDIPSSGLILTGTTFEGLYWIRWQLNVYMIERQYYVMCQGLAPADLRQVDAPIDVRSHMLGSHRSLTVDHGGPALTWISVCAQAQPGFDAPAPLFISPCTHMPVLCHRSETLTSVCIRIRTGRKHQIRTHLLHSGHPTIVDGMYTSREVTISRLTVHEKNAKRSGRFAHCPV